MSHNLSVEDKTPDEEGERGGVVVVVVLLPFF